MTESIVIIDNIASVLTVVIVIYAFVLLPLDLVVRELTGKGIYYNIQLIKQKRAELKRRS